MNVSYKRDMTHNYMVPETTENVSEDDYRVHMLMENHIRGLLPCCVRRVNCQSRFFYDITSRQSMEHIYGNSRMRAEDIRQLLRGLYRALREIKKYLLDMDRIVLEPKMIYMDIETREPLFCYLPGYQKDIMQSFRELTMYLMERLDDNDQRAVLLGYEIYRRAREENYSLEKILQEAGAPEEIRELDRQKNAGWSGQTTAFRQGEGDGQATAFRQGEGDSQTTAFRQGEGDGQTMAFRQGAGGGQVVFPRKSAGDGQGFFSGRMQAMDDKRRKSGRERPEEKNFAQDGAEDFPDFGQSGFSSENIGPEEEHGIFKKKERKEKKKKEKRPKEKEQREKEDTWAGRLFLVICFLVAVALLAAAAWFWKMTLTQIGGVAFLLIGILIYGCTMDSRKKKGEKKKKANKVQRALEDFEEEEWPEEPAPQYRQAMHVGERTRYGTGTQGTYGGAAESPKPYGTQAAGGGRSDRRAGTWYGAQAAGGGSSDRRAGAWYGAQAAERRLGDTGVLVEGADNESHLILVSTNPQRRDSIVLEKDSYVVGKLPAQADIVLEHPSVSRVHAKLDRLGNDYYLCDLNSTNGTFVNGRRLMVNESVKLNPSDEIAFARVGFQVVKY